MIGSLTFVIVSISIYSVNQGVKASPPGKAPGLVSISHIPKNIEATINKIGIENMIMIALPSLRYLVSFIKNSPKKKRNSHPGYSGTALRKLIKMYPHRISLK